MSAVIVVDTDVLIDYGHHVEQALTCLKQLEQQATLAVSIITKMELVVGCRNKIELRNMEKLVSDFQLLQLDHFISNKADELLLKYRLSHGLLIPDALIAATAISFNYPLISKNQKDYRFIEELELLAYP